MLSEFLTRKTVIQRTQSGRSVQDAFNSLNDDSFDDIESFLDTVKTKDKQQQPGSQKPVPTTTTSPTQNSSFRGQRTDTKLRNILDDLQSDLDSL